MKTIYARQTKPMKACFDFDPSKVRPLVLQQGNFVTVDAGWVTLDLGRDATWSEFVLASSSADSFLLSAEPPAAAKLWNWGDQKDWVFATDHFPEELFYGMRPPTEFHYAGFRVVHAADQRRKNFIFVGMPGGKTNFLFLNPQSRAALAWTRRSTTAVNHPVLMPMPTPIVTEPTQKKPMVEVGTGDAELDAMLAELAS